MFAFEKRIRVRTVRLISIVSLSAACAVSATALVGCSAADRLLYKHATDRYGDRTDFTEHSVIDAEWVPADATEITVRRSIVSGDAVVLLRSSSDLHMQCIEVERMTAPLWFLDGAPAVYDLDSVFECHDWWVAPTDAGDGWYGWTADAADEEASARLSRDSKAT